MGSSMWGNLDEGNAPASVKEILTEQSKILRDSTRGYVDARLGILDTDYPGLKGISGNADFAFEFFLCSKYLPDFQFSIFHFCHEVLFYPVKFFQVDEGVLRELKLAKVGRPTVCVSGSEDEARVFIGQVLGSKRIGTVVSSILKLAK